MITLYLKPTDKPHLVVKMLQDELGAAQNIKSHVNKLSVLEGIACIQQRVKLMRDMPENGLAMFYGDGEVTLIEPIKPIRNALYRCDKKFHVDQLLDMICEDSRYGFVVMDGHGCLFGAVQGAEKKTIHKMTVDLPKKHGSGGQSSMRFARLRLEKRAAYVKKVAELTTQYFISDDNKPNVSGMILAGSAEFKEVLLDSLDPRLKSAVLKIVTVEHSMEQGLSEAISLSSDCMSGAKFIRQKSLLDKLQESLRDTPTLVAVGTKEVMTAIDWSATDTILIWDGHDMLDSLVESGMPIELITNNTDEGSLFCRALGGIAAFLRFEVHHE